MSWLADEDRQHERESLRMGQDRDLRIRWLGLYVLFAVVAFGGLFLYVSWVSNRLERERVTADLTLARAIAGQLGTAGQVPATTADETAAWLALISVDEAAVISVVDADGQFVVNATGKQALPENADWARWQRVVARRALQADEPAFTTTAPDGREWLHATAPSSAGWRAIVQRPAQTAFAPTHIYYQMLAITVALYLVGGGFFWFILSRQLIQPLERLETFSGLIRWRGRIRPEEQTQLAALTERQDQLGSLARSLVAMDQDIDQRLVQLSTLLETSRVVASSLDVTEVIENIFDQVQKLFGVERCAVMTLDQRADVFRIQASRGMSDWYVRQIAIDPSEPNSPAMRALRNESPIQVSDTETDLAFAYFRDRSHREGIRSLLAIPLLTRHAPPAVLNMYKTEPYRYSYGELELAASFGHHASIAMENAALYALTDERLQEQTRRLEAIVESLGDGLILEGLDGEVLFCNRRALAWLHLSRREARRKTSAELVERLLAQTREPEAARQRLAAALSGTGPRTFDIARQVNGRTRDVRIHLFGVTDARGEQLGRGQLWQDVTRDKELDRMKSALLSTVSHELRTPLATIKGYASTLLAKDVEWDAAAQREFLTTISTETDRLTNLVKNLLDVSRIEAGLLQVRCEPYALNALVRDVVQNLPPGLRARLRLDLADDLPPAPIDISRVETVARNYIENAAKYSPPETPIDLSTRRENGRLAFSVRDYGPGVPAAYRDKIFDRFFRADNRLTREVGGAGLGLAICKGFIEAHNGRVWVRPAEPGAIFGFSLPLERESAEIKVLSAEWKGLSGKG